VKDEHRKQLDNRLTPIHLFKLTPKTNCSKCGHPTCLAFSTQTIVGRAKLDDCPFLEPKVLKSFRAHLEEQHRSGIGVSREGFEKTLEYLRSEMSGLQLHAVAESLGAVLTEKDGDRFLRLLFWGEEVLVGRQKVVAATGVELNPWEQILLYNYILGGAAKPSGIWVGMESLPNSISKVKSLKTHCEDRVAEAFSNRVEDIPGAVEGWGRLLDVPDKGVDVAAEFQILPNLSVRVLFWDEDRVEGFGAKAKFLFDSRVLQVVDLESLIFASEQLTDRLLHASRPPGRD
jgi:hypothetical protein